MCENRAPLQLLQTLYSVPLEYLEKDLMVRPGARRPPPFLSCVLMMLVPSLSWEIIAFPLRSTVFNLKRNLNGGVVAGGVYSKPTHAAELLVTQDGKFVYISNRGHDTIAAFSVDATTGLLTLIQLQESGGAGKRHLVVSPIFYIM
jgi:hypothetical protein